MTDIEALNARYNRELIERGIEGFDSLVGLVQWDGSRVLLYPDDLYGESIVMTREEAVSLGAALLTITKEAGDSN